MDSELYSLIQNGRSAVLKRELLSAPEKALVPGVLLVAAYFKENGVCELLFDHGAILDEAALLCAAETLDVELVKLMLTRGGGASLLAPDEKGIKALDRLRHAHELLRQSSQVNVGFLRCANQCIELVEEALSHARRARARRRWRAVVSAISMLRAWHLRAAERCFVPGGAGYEEARSDFSERRGQQLEGGQGTQDDALTQVK